MDQIKNEVQMQAQPMTPFMRTLHEAHVARLDRIKARAVPDHGIDLRLKAETRPVVQVSLPSMDHLAWEAAEARVWHMVVALPQRRPAATIPQIQNAVCYRFQITKSDLISACRTLNLVRPRQIACYLCCRLTQKPLTQIGHHMGGRDHTTVIWADKQMTSKRATDQKLNSAIIAICEILTFQGVDTSAVPHVQQPHHAVEESDILLDNSDPDVYTYSHRIAMKTVGANRA